MQLEPKSFCTVCAEGTRNQAVLLCLPSPAEDSLWAQPPSSPRFYGHECIAHSP